MKKSILAILLACALALLLTACGKDEDLSCSSDTSSQGTANNNDMSTPSNNRSNKDEHPEDSVPANGLMRIGNNNTGYIDAPDHLTLLENNSSENMLTYNIYNSTKAGSDIQIVIRVDFDYKNSAAPQKSPEEFANLYYSTGKNAIKAEIETKTGNWWKVKYTNESTTGELRYWAYYYTENNGNLYMIQVVAKEETSFAFRLIETFDFTQ